MFYLPLMNNNNEILLISLRVSFLHLFVMLVINFFCKKKKANKKSYIFENNTQQSHFFI